MAQCLWSDSATLAASYRPMFSKLDKTQLSAYLKLLKYTIFPKYCFFNKKTNITFLYLPVVRPALPVPVREVEPPAGDGPAQGVAEAKVGAVAGGGPGWRIHTQLKKSKTK